MNIISNDDIRRLRSGELYKNDCDSLSIKMALGMVNFCVNMLNVREDATESALKFIMTNVEKRKSHWSLCRNSTFTESQCSGDDKRGTMIRNKVFDPKITGAENEITSEMVCESNFDLDTFVAEDNDLRTFEPIDFSDLLNAFSYENDGLNE